MTVYVDNMQIPAAIQNGARVHDSTWSHLTADTQAELHEFAQQLGLKRSYFQPGKSIGGRPSVGWHYDVTKGMRFKAIRMGAKEIGMHEMADLMMGRRAEQQEEPSTERELDRLAGEAFRAGNASQALGLLGLARMAYPEHAEWWDRRAARINGADMEAAS